MEENNDKSLLEVIEECTKGTMNNHQSLSIRQDLLDAADKLELIAKKLRKDSKKALGDIKKHSKDILDSLSIQENILYTADTLMFIAKRLRRDAKKALGERELENVRQEMVSDLYVTLAMYEGQDVLDKTNVK